MKWFWALGLAQKFLIAVSAGLIVLFAAFLGVSTSLQTSIMENATKDVEKVIEDISDESAKNVLAGLRVKATGTAVMLSEIAPDAIAARELRSLKTYVNTAAHDPDIIYAAYLRTNGRVITKSGEREGIRDDMIVSLNIESEGVALGVVEVGFQDVQAVTEINAIRDAGRQNVALIDERQMEAMGTSTAWMISMLLGVAVLVGALISLLFAKLVKTPLRNVETAMVQLADGNLEAEVPGTGREDEIGRMANALQVFKERMIENKVHQEKEEQRKAEKAQAEQVRLEREAEIREQKLLDEKRQQEQAEADRKALLLDTASALDTSVGDSSSHVFDMVKLITEKACEMAEVANKTKGLGDSTANESESVTHNIDTMATAIEELSASIAEINRIATESLSLSERVVTQAEDSQAKAENLREHSEGIQSVVDLINDIAEQTNLLALNATIEAARAGDAGKGFAVVASEVKNLATQTAAATEEISHLIETVQEATREMVETTSDIRTISGDMKTSSSAIFDSVAAQDEATRHLSLTTQETSKCTHRLNSFVIDVQKNTEHTCSAANSVTDFSTDLGGSVNTMRDSVDGFISQIRAG